MKRKLFASLLAVCLVLSLCCAMVLSVGAESTEDVVASVVDESGKSLLEAKTLIEALTRASIKENSTIKLVADIEAYSGFDIKGTYTLDLNGHTLTANAPLIQTEGTVTIIDSSAEGTGKLTGVNSAALILKTGNVIVKSGTILVHFLVVIQ